MGEILLGTYKSYVNSVHAPHIQSMIPDTTLDVAMGSSSEKSFPDAEDVQRNALPAEDDEDMPLLKRQGMRNPLAKRGWPFSSGYKLSARDLEIRSQYLPMPKRVISPWCTNWEGRELNEMVLFKSFGNPRMSENCLDESCCRPYLSCFLSQRCTEGINGGS